MTTPVKTAYCPLLFQRNGGKFGPRNEPIFEPNEDEDSSPMGTCSRAFDCGTCTLMTEWLNGAMTGWTIGWECDKCLKETFELDKDSGVDRWLPGFYHSSPDENAYEGGCTRCGWQTLFLNLVLRR